MLSSRRFLIIEYLLLFGALPAAIAAFKPHGWIYLLLWLAAMLSCWTLSKHFAWSFRADWNAAGVTRAALKSILLRFLPCAAALFIFTWLAIPDHLFSLPHDRPLVWMMVMLLYPPLSAVPQEIIFRSFIFRRFGALFEPSMRTTPESRSGAMVLASAVAFGWVHIVLMNWVAVIFSGLGGLLFAHTYGKTKSLAAACFEHALYGCYIFTIGLGFYFYH